jgi:chromosome partitioning protein
MSMREPARPIPKKEDPAERIVRHAGVLSSQMQALRERMYPPHAEKSLRYFMTNEVSKHT